MVPQSLADDNSVSGVSSKGGVGGKHARHSRDNNLRRGVLPWGLDRKLSKSDAMFVPSTVRLKQGMHPIQDLALVFTNGPMHTPTA